MAETECQRYAVTPGVGSVFFSADQLRIVSEVAGPDGQVEMNSFMQLIVHASGTDVTQQIEHLRSTGLGVYPVGPVVKNIQTCTFCMGDRVEGLPDAQRLDQAVAGMPVPFPVRVGFSGCANNCGEALMRDIGVVLVQPGRFDIYIGGRPGGLSPEPGTRVAAGVAASDLVRCVEAILHCYRRHARGKERFWKHVRRIGTGPFMAAISAASPCTNRPSVDCARE